MTTVDKIAESGNCPCEVCASQDIIIIESNLTSENLPTFLAKLGKSLNEFSANLTMDTTETEQNSFIDGS